MRLVTWSRAVMAAAPVCRPPSEWWPRAHCTDLSEIVTVIATLHILALLLLVPAQNYPQFVFCSFL